MQTRTHSLIVLSLKLFSCMPAMHNGRWWRWSWEKQADKRSRLESLENRGIEVSIKSGTLAEEWKRQREGPGIDMRSWGQREEFGFGERLRSARILRCVGQRRHAWKLGFVLWFVSFIGGLRGVRGEICIVTWKRIATAYLQGSLGLQSKDGVGRSIKSSYLKGRGLISLAVGPILKTLLWLNSYWLQ